MDIFSQNEQKLWLTWDSQKNEANMCINYYLVLMGPLPKIVEHLEDVNFLHFQRSGVTLVTKSELMNKSLTKPNPELENKDNSRHMFLILLYLQWCPFCVFGVTRIILWNGIIIIIIYVYKGES